MVDLKLLTILLRKKIKDQVNGQEHMRFLDHSLNALFLILLREKLMNLEQELLMLEDKVYLPMRLVLLPVKQGMFLLGLIEPTSMRLDAKLENHSLLMLMLLASPHQRRKWLNKPRRNRCYRK